MPEFMVFGYSGQRHGATTHHFRVSAINRTDAKQQVRGRRAFDGLPITRIAATEWMPYHDGIGKVKDLRRV